MIPRIPASVLSRRALLVWLASASPMALADSAAGRLLPGQKAHVVSSGHGPGVSTGPAPRGDGRSPGAAAPTPSGESILVRARRLERMQVKSGGQLGALGHVSGLDAPFNIRSYTASLILNQQSQTLGQVLQNDPSVRTTLGYGNFSEIFVIRGFPVYGDDVAINGLYGITPRQLVSPQIFDSVQVLNGAGAFLNGAAPGGTAIGGNINLLMKHATETPIARLTGDYTSNAMGGGAIDLGRRFGVDHAFGARLNVAGLSGRDAIDHERRHSMAIGGDLDWHDAHTRLSLDMDYQNEGVNWGRPALFLGSGITGVPRPPSPTTNFGQPWTFTNLGYVFGMLDAEHDLTKNVTLYGAFGGLGGHERGNYGTSTINAARTGDGTVGNLYVPYIQTNESTRAGARIHGDTGPLHHAVNLGGSSVWEEADTAYALGFAPAATDLYRPIYSAAPDQSVVGGNLAHPKPTSEIRLYSLYFSDTVSAFHNLVALTGGFRYQNILTNNYAAYTAGPQIVRTSRTSTSAITPVVGVVVHPTRVTSLYFNRIEGLAQGPTAPGTAINAGQVFAPYRSAQYEIGAKYDIGRFAASLAVYQIAQPNAYSRPFGAGGQTIFTVDGQQRNRGIELNLNGDIVRGLRFNGGATVIDADLRRTARGLQNGNTAIGVPDYTINGNLEYDLPFMRGLTATGRVVDTGRQWVNTANTQRIPTWTTVDLGARYTFLAASRPLTLRFGVENLANRRYWSSALGGYLLQGMPRTFKASFTMDL